MIRPTCLTVALWLALAGITHAEVTAEASGEPVAREFDRIQVTATRTQRAIVDVPNTVSVIDRKQMDEQLMRDIKALVRYEPGVSVTSSFGRFGLGGFRIRGLEGNRVSILTDGIPVSDAFAIGSFSNANRNFVDLDTLKQVEIVRGPGSSLYGSDALGGVVAFVTKDPSDYLKEGSDAYFGYRLGYDSAWRGLFAGATAAFGGDAWSGMVVANHRQGQATRNQGTVDTDDATRTTPNPQDIEGRSVLSKLVYAPSETQRFKLVVEGSEDIIDTDVLAARGYQALPRATTLSMLGRDRQTRVRVALRHELDALSWLLADHLTWQVYRQDSETTQRTREERTTVAAGSHRRDREFNFDQRVYGVQATLHKGFATDSTQHELTYGVDLSRTDLRQKRDGLVTYRLTGVTTPVMSPDVFPVRDFPNSTTTNAAFYMQDEIGLGDGRFTVVPGVRIDHYKLDPSVDNIFAEDNPGVVVADITKTSVSPKLGMVWRFARDWSLFGGYAHGFRAPPYSDVNLGFTNLQFGYTAIPNPNLKPETSDGLEFGVRYAGPVAYASLSGYYNHYDDFIESLRFIGYNAEGLMLYQSQNVSKAEIHGVEMKAGMDLGVWRESLAGWSLRGAAAWAKGRDRTSNEPLPSVDPLTATLGLVYERSAWGAELVGRFARRRTDVPAATEYAAPGYGVLDLMMHWNLVPGAQLNLGVFNLADRKYWETASLPSGVSGSSTVLDRYTAPGRTVSASVSVGW